MRREDELDQLHLRHGVEHVQPDETVRPAAGARQLLDRQRGCGAGEDRRAVHDRVELRQQARLDIVILYDGLDHERRVPERGGVRHHLHVLRIDVGAQAAEGLLDRRAGAVGGAVRPGQQRHGPMVGRRGRHAAGDGAAAGYGQAIAQDGPFGRRSSVVAAARID